RAVCDQLARPWRLHLEWINTLFARFWLRQIRREIKLPRSSVQERLHDQIEVGSFDPQRCSRRWPVIQHTLAPRQVDEIVPPSACWGSGAGGVGHVPRFSGYGEAEPVPKDTDISPRS